MARIAYRTTWDNSIEGKVSNGFHGNLCHEGWCQVILHKTPDSQCKTCFIRCEYGCSLAVNDNTHSRWEGLSYMKLGLKCVSIRDHLEDTDSQTLLFGFTQTAKRSMKLLKMRETELWRFASFARCGEITIETLDVILCFHVFKGAKNLVERCEFLLLEPGNHLLEFIHWLFRNEYLS